MAHFINTEIISIYFLSGIAYVCLLPVQDDAPCRSSSGIEFQPYPVGSCTFVNNDTCGYILEQGWETFNGPYLYHGRERISSGSDDGYYAFANSDIADFRITQTPSMISQQLPPGEYCVSFAYIEGTAMTLIDLKTISSQSTNTTFWTVDDRAMPDWKNVSVTVISNATFQIAFAVHFVRVNHVAIDNINVWKACAELNIDNGNITYCDKTAHVSCYEGYENTGQTFATCENGIWNVSITNCRKVDCGNFTAPANGSVRLQSTNFESIATLSCNPGYIMHGPNTARCKSTGMWSRNETFCDPTDCGNIPGPINGKVNLTSTTFQSVATFSCNQGYYLHGQNLTQCQSNGTWSYTLKSCQLGDCGNITAPMNGTVKLTSTKFQSVATFTCNQGYYLHGENSTQCQSNGTWSNTLPSCQPKGCGNISAPINGHVYLTSTEFQSVATFSCDSGYQLFGENRTTCMHNGIWKTVTVVCKPDIVNLNVAIDATCTSVGWNVLINMSALKIFYPTVKPTDIFFGDSSCKGESVDDKLWFRQGFNDCSTVEKTEPNNIVYSNDLIYAIFDTNNPFVIRHHLFTLNVECDVQRTEAASSHVHHETIHQHVNFTLHNNISMAFYKDANFREPISGNPLHAHVGDQVYAKVYTTLPDWNIKLRLHTCYIKPPQTSESSMEYFLIKDGCETDTNTHIISQSAHETTFVFQDFEYSTNREGLDILCNATFCETTDYSPKCTQRCLSNPIVIG